MSDENLFNNLLKQEPVEITEQYEKIQNGITILFREIKGIENKSFDFTDDGGETKTVKRKIYIRDKGSLLVPMIVHRQIKTLNDEYGENLKSVKVLVEGSGIQTRYTVIPVINVR